MFSVDGFLISNLVLHIHIRFSFYCELCVLRVCPSLDIVAEFRESSVLTWAGCGRGCLLSPPGVQDVRFVAAELRHCDLRVVRLHMLHDVGFGLVLIRRGLCFRDSWRPPSILGLRNRRLARRDKCWRHHSGTYCLRVMIISRSWQFLLLLPVVVVELIDTISVTFHPFAHGKVNTFCSKCLRFFIWAWARRCDLLGCFIVELVDVNFCHIATT